MEKTKKMTKMDKFARLLAIPAVANDKISAEFIQHEMELLAKKNSADRTNDKEQKVKNDIKETILDLLADVGEPMTISEMQKASAELGKLANQRITALVRQLMRDGKVVREEIKRKAYFKLAE
jgi:hypothetical protein